MYVENSERASRMVVREGRREEWSGEEGKGVGRWFYVLCFNQGGQEYGWQ